MLDERLESLKIPKNLRTPVERLLRSLDDASSKAEVDEEAEIQISFIKALESDKRLRPADIEALYIFFDDAVQARLQAL